MTGQSNAISSSFFFDADIIGEEIPGSIFSFEELSSTVRLHPTLPPSAPNPALEPSLLSHCDTEADDVATSFSSEDASSPTDASPTDARLPIAW